MVTRKTNSNRALPRTRSASVLSSAEVWLWGAHVGTVMEFSNGRIGFSYTRDYLASGGPAVSPQFLPLEQRTFEFPDLLRQEAFNGLPGVLADSLPDTFGNLVIKKYFEERGQIDKAMSPVQRLLYVGNRAMGALEFKPTLQRPTKQEEQALEIKSLVESARRLIEGEAGEAVHEIMRVGGSAGGARAKALILWNKTTNHVRSGFVSQQEGEDPFLIKFDGVSSANERDHQARPYNRIEYTYALVAKNLGIEMEEVEFIEDNGLFHFVTRRFDRDGQSKFHMHSLGGMTHVDFNLPGVYSYEAWFRLILKLGLGYQTLEQAFRRMLFNIVGRNQDDHVKNISFLMKSPNSGWQLSPAYDLTYSAGSGYTRQHQMSVTGKTDEFTRDELIAVGDQFGISSPGKLLEETISAFASWPSLAKAVNVPLDVVERVHKSHRLKL